jgi:hypothetical protein
LSAAISAPFTGSIFSEDRMYAYFGTTDIYTGALWNDREYVSGSNGENGQITLDNHNAGHDRFDFSLTPAPANIASGYGFPITLKPATGEGFIDTLNANPSSALAGYNANYGVAISGTGASMGICASDNSLWYVGLQVKSATTYAIFDCDHGNSVSVVADSIIEGGSGAGTALGFGTQGNAINSLIVSHGYSGVSFSYGGHVYNNTIVCPDSSCAGSAIENTWSWITPFGTVINGNAAFGFAHFIAAQETTLPPTCGYGCATWQGTNNATDVASTDGSTFPAVSYNSGKWYVMQFATSQPYCMSVFDGSGGGTLGTCTVTNSVSPSATFLAWPGNYKINASSSLYGAGASFGTWNWCGVITGGIAPPWTTWTGCTITADTPDIFGTPRPQNARYDIGAMEVNSGFGPLAPFGGRMLLR